MKDIITQSAAVKLLGIKNRQTLNNWLRRGKITAHDLGGRTGVSLAEVRAFMGGR